MREASKYNPYQDSGLPPRREFANGLRRRTKNVAKPGVGPAKSVNPSTAGRPRSMLAELLCDYHYFMTPRPLAVRPEEHRAFRRTCSQERAGIGGHEATAGDVVVELQGRGRVRLSSSPPQRGATSRNRPPRWAFLIPRRRAEVDYCRRSRRQSIHDHPVRRPIARVPHKHWKTTTFLASMRNSGLTTPLARDEARGLDQFLVELFSLTAHPELFRSPPRLSGQHAIGFGLGRARHSSAANFRPAGKREPKS
jgi:hypothetical protein